MSKKKEIKKIFENMQLESSDAHAELSGKAKEQAGQEASPFEVEPSVDEAAGLRAEMLAAKQEEQPDTEPAAQLPASDTEQTGEEAMIPGTGIPTSEQEPEEDSPDDLLEDVRQSLLEEEAHEEQPKWWRRIGRSSRKKSVEEGTPNAVEEINLPALSAIQAENVEANVHEQTETDEYQEQIDDLIDLLETEEEPVQEGQVPIPVEGPAEPEKPVDIEELKKQAFQSRPAGENESLTEVRAIALEGDEEVFVEVEAKPQDPLEERLSAVENALNPYRRYLNFGLAFLGLIMAVLAGLLMYNVYQRSAVQSAPTMVSNLPYPTTVGLPGGWEFNLGKGALTAEGRWNPAGAEWLQGTEVCRWVALPWSRQLEAVIRTLNPDDPIQLGMSNNDKLTYNVRSIKQMSSEEMQELDSNSPCLLIVLAEPDVEERWVLTALP